MLFESVAVAQTTSGQPAAGSGGGDFTSLMPMILALMVLFYFVVWRPQQREQQKTKQLREGVKKGDEVRSIGGIYGTVVSVDTGRRLVTVQVDKGVNLKFAQEAISAVIKQDEPQTSEKKDEKK